MVAPNPKPTVATNLHRQYFSALHKTLQQQYSAECNCPVCKNSIATLGVNENPKFKKVLNAGKKAFKRLYKNGKYSPNDLFEVKEYNELINATKEVFDTAITNQIGDSMRSYLKQDSFVFSGLKTHTQIAEASSYLLDQKGNVQPYYKFEQQVSKLNQRYNNSYLKAEYHFAVGSGQSIERWESFSDDEDRYWLQYRTAGDGKVRDSHAILHNTTLPKSDPFWDSYAAPNGWRCRCTTVEVLARKHQKSNSKKAMKKGEAATTKINKNGKNTLAMFRFNPAKQKKLFPPKNSYMPKHCKSGKLSADTLPVATRYVLSQPQNAIFLSLENDRCKAKKIIEEEIKKAQRRRELHTLSMARNKQFTKINSNVSEHLLVKKIDDYEEIKETATLLCKNGGKAELLPIIEASLQKQRKVVFPNYSNLSANPDIRYNGNYYDLKRPKTIRRILKNANKASYKQNCIAIISDSQLDKPLTDRIMENRAKHIFTSEEYNEPIVIFKRGKEMTVFDKNGKLNSR